MSWRWCASSRSLPKVPDPGSPRSSSIRVAPSLVVLLTVLAPLAGCSRVTGLPEVPASVTARDAGLENLEVWARESHELARVRHGVDAGAAGDPGASGATEGLQGVSRAHDEAEVVGGKEMTPPPALLPEDPIKRARWGLDEIAQGRAPEGLRALAEALERKPEDIVLGNAYRMAVYRLTRATRAEAKKRGERTPEPPAFLRGEPFVTLERIAARASGREIRMQLALAYVDRMVLNPALEIKAPASIDSVVVLTQILQKDPYYVPALVGRGLNALYRPRNLVWPQHPAPPPDAGSRDLSLAAAVGAKVGGAPPRLKGLLLTMLGDACAHEGHVGVARSWWMLAREVVTDESIDKEIGLRMTWSDSDAPDKLEERLGDRMEDMDNPVGDLSFLWSDARGPS